MCARHTHIQFYKLLCRTDFSFSAKKKKKRWSIGRPSDICSTASSHSTHESAWWQNVKYVEIHRRRHGQRPRQFRMWIVDITWHTIDLQITRLTGTHTHTSISNRNTRADKLVSFCADNILWLAAVGYTNIAWHIYACFITITSATMRGVCLYAQIYLFSTDAEHRINWSINKTNPNSLYIRMGEKGRNIWEGRREIQRKSKNHKKSDQTMSIEFNYFSFLHKNNINTHTAFGRCYCCAIQMAHTGPDRQNMERDRCDASIGKFNFDGLQHWSSITNDNTQP